MEILYHFFEALPEAKIAVDLEDQRRVVSLQVDNTHFRNRFCIILQRLEIQG